MNSQVEVESEIFNKFLWSKSNPRKSLLCHLSQTAAVARVLVSDGCYVPLRKELQAKLKLDESQVTALVCYLAAMHDISKIHPAFVGNPVMKDACEYLESNGLNCCTENFRHEKYALECLNRIFKCRGFSPRTHRRLTYVIRFHHQKNVCSQSELLNDDRAAIWKSLQDKMETIFWELFNPPTEFEISHTDVVCTLLLGIVITADWIASGSTFDDSAEHDDARTIYNDALVKAKAFLTENDMLYTPPIRVERFTQMWEKISESGMRPLQKSIDKVFENVDEKPLAVIIEASMGEGKTETALYAASRLAELWDKEGFYVALPTAATSNQMYSRVNDMLLSRHISSAKLMHSMAWLMDEKAHDTFCSEESDQIYKWTLPMCKGLIAPYAVGTVDQVMLATTAVKFGVLRLSGLATKVLIIDECHAYDTYMTDMLEKLLKWCRALHIPVVMLSATLPSAKKTEFISIYSDSDDNSAFMSVKTRLGDDSVRLALVPYDLYQRVKSEDRVSHETAREVLGYSFSARFKTVEAFLKKANENGDKPICSDGLLFGLYIFPAKDGICTFDDGKVLQMDYNEGFLIKE